MIWILLVDDQAIVRLGWAMRFALEPGIAVTGLAGDGRGPSLANRSRLRSC